MELQSNWLFALKGGRYLLEFINYEILNFGLLVILLMVLRLNRLSAAQHQK